MNKEDLIKKGYVESSPGVWKKFTVPVKVATVKPKEELRAVMPVKIHIKPLSVNEAFKGRRFKTDKYKEFQNKVLSILPPIDLPEPPYCIYFKFGFSSKSSDWDNAIKQSQDVLATFYGFNDRLIRKGIVEIEIVPKGKEYFIFDITHLPSAFSTSL